MPARDSPFGEHERLFGQGVWTRGTLYGRPNGYKPGTLLACRRGNSTQRERLEGRDHSHFGGRLAPEKNWETLLQAVAKVYPDHSNLRLVLIGDGPARESLQTLAAELGIAERVTFMGSVPFEEVAAYLKAANAFSFASVTETQGLVTIEAMAASLPVVAVDGSGTRDIVEHGKEGFLVENDLNALAKGLHDLLSNPRQMKQFSHNTLKKAKTFDVNQLSKQLINVYERAIQDKKEDLYVTLKTEETTEAASPSQI